jgi:hypothetical protein
VDAHRKCLDYFEEDWRAFDCTPDCPAWGVLINQASAIVKIREGIQQLRDTFDNEHPTADDELAGLRQSLEDAQRWLYLTDDDVARITTTLRESVGSHAHRPRPAHRPSRRTNLAPLEASRTLECVWRVFTLPDRRAGERQPDVGRPQAQGVEAGAPGARQHPTLHPDPAGLERGRSLGDRTLGRAGFSREPAQGVPSDEARTRGLDPPNGLEAGPNWT